MRTASMVLGIIGSVFGIIAAIFAMLVGGIGHAFHASSSGEITGLGWGALFLSVVGLVGSILVRNFAKVAGILMLIGGVGGIICVSYFFILPGILLIIPGVMSMFVRNRPQPSATHSA
ncbi:DUF4064 domain-containing protein [Alicyclobacillus fastidiosus]|uniref:DUF4064 domain-containing protein n=1 Tax=Alicyclobacillus fastidiosus TaxID=392011 RepID=A0ABY6ZL13_9BACL|nr:DUF4064 domain-containing protein [Alicyclobacillus fastidiosus]WAH42794.1 DUF4064 domain-containing protein [Alicyclobacillus fastidiosus]